jgi:hypothetical protein
MWQLPNLHGSSYVLYSLRRIFVSTLNTKKTTLTEPHYLNMDDECGDFLDIDQQIFDEFCADALETDEGLNAHAPTNTSINEIQNSETSKNDLIKPGSLSDIAIKRKNRTKTKPDASGTRKDTHEWNAQAEEREKKLLEQEIHLIADDDEGEQVFIVFC